MLRGDRVALRRVIKIILLIFLAVASVALLALYVFFPRDAFVIFHRPGGGTVMVGRGTVRFEPPPDRYPTDGFDHLHAYIAKLLDQSQGFRSVIVATNGDRACSFWSRHGRVEVALSVEWREEPGREARIRAFFADRGIDPSEDYLAGNGDVPDATRSLTYPLSGDASALTKAAQIILEELCGISRSDALNVRYSER